MVYTKKEKAEIERGFSQESRYQFQLLILHDRNQHEA